MKKLSATVTVGLIVALIGGGLVFWYGRQVDKRIADGKKTVGVLVALESLVAGTPSVSLKGKTQIRLVPQAFVPKGFLSNLDSVGGLVLLGPLPEGSTLNRGHFGSPATVAAVEPAEGNVALAIEMDLSPGVARYVGVGSFVDIFVTYEGGGGGTGAGLGLQPQSAAQSSGQKSPTAGRTKLFVTGVKVLAVSIAERRSERTDESGRRGRIVQGEEEGADKVIAVLDVDPITAEKIVNALTLGELYLALSKQDGNHKTPNGAVPDDVIVSNR